MAITNGYCTLNEFKAYMNTTSTDTADDGVIEDIIEGASRLIDSTTARTFYARTETHYYNTPSGYELWIDDDDLLTITTLTNGDGTTISSGDYKLMPLNKSPKYMIYLKPSSNLIWALDSDSEALGAITILGTWGYSATAPDDIRQACLIISASEYRKRFGDGVGAAATVTAAGVVLTPQGMPKSALDLIRNYIKVV